MSDAPSASVLNDDGPPPVDDEKEPKAKAPPPPLPSSRPIVKIITTDNSIKTNVPVGNLINVDDEESATVAGNGLTTKESAGSSTTPALTMDGLMYAFLEEERTTPPSDYIKKFYQIRIEQEKLRSEPDFRTDCAVSPHHYNRNRYRDILPYDHNRVELRNQENNPGGYMNASFIQLPGGKTSFIAAQAPLSTTLDEWWNMIDEQKVSLIVILCKLFEQGKPKCERYWPEEVGESEVYGDYEITLEEEKTFADDEYMLRVIKMTNQKSSETRSIYQLHYREWPDHGCPSGEKQLLNMIDLMEGIHDEHSKDAPVLVHCSAGVGRTGTIIAINYIREQMKAETLKNIDIFALVCNLRKQRASMVQTQDQFMFVHKCIASYCRRWLGITEPALEEHAPTQMPVGDGGVRLIAPPTPTTSDQTGVAQYQPDTITGRIVEDESDATSVPDFPEEPPAPKGPEDLGSSAAL